MIFKKVPVTPKDAPKIAVSSHKIRLRGCFLLCFFVIHSNKKPTQDKNPNRSDPTEPSVSELIRISWLTPVNARKWRWACVSITGIEHDILHEKIEPEKCTEKFSLLRYEKLRIW